MLEEHDFQAIADRFDDRYKLRDDCAREMDAVTDNMHHHDVDVALIKQQLNIIKWIATSTLGAVIATAVGLILNAIMRS